eukprot:TRINITY_DN4560_c2_g1_i1.p1 TRINITY_DN4560_c2_g1~~TRINITY_DN4560_c2_g1_i1.p1  ORF type:complete len:826 (-),score=196.28 TRINITY_DN4560_c2_g1_i1:55-2316(-)
MDIVVGCAYQSSTSRTEVALIAVPASTAAWSPATGRDVFTLSLSSSAAAAAAAATSGVGGGLSEETPLRSHGNVDRVFVSLDANRVSSTDKESASPFLQIGVGAQDHSFTLFEASIGRGNEGTTPRTIRSLWTREEALASIHHAEFLELPAEESVLSSYQHEFPSDDDDGSIQNVIHRVLVRVQAQITQLVSASHSLMERLSAAALAGDNADVARQLADAARGLLTGKAQGAGTSGGGARRHGVAGGAQILSKDDFGFRRLLVAVSPRAGKVYALHTVTGEAVWSKVISPVGRGDNGIALKALLLTRSSLHSPVTLLAYELEGSSTTVFEWINPLTGDSLGTKTLPFRVSQVLLLDSVDADHEHFVLVVSRDDASHPHIVGSSGRETLGGAVAAPRGSDSVGEGVYYFLVDEIEGNVEGYLLSTTTTSQPSSSLAWTVKFNNNNNNADEDGYERVVSVTLRSTCADRHGTYSSAIDSPVLTMPNNQSVVAKYLNPHTVAVSTVSISHTSKGKEYTLHVYLIDSVTGGIVYRTQHRHANGPVEVVLADHWLVYHYWSTTAHRYHLNVVELYERELQWDATTFSSFDSQRPIAREQAYEFPFGVTASGVTQTLRGITEKQILLATTSNQVIALPKRLLDTRRVSKEEHKQQHGEAFLFPYSPHLPLSQASFVTYNATVARVTGIITSPSELESACHVFCYGLDVFYSLTYPSAHFDQLSQDFDTVLVIVTMTALVLLTFASHYMAKKKALNKAWE